MRRVVCLGLLLMFVSGSLEAGDPSSRGEETNAAAQTSDTDFSYSPNWPQPPDTSGLLMRLGFGTVVTLGLCVGTLVIGRRWLQRPTAGGTSRQLHIEESVVLGHRATLFLVKVGDSRLVVGTDAGGLKSLIALPTTFAEVLDQQIPTTESAPPDMVPLLRAA